MSETTTPTVGSSFSRGGYPGPPGLVCECLVRIAVPDLVRGYHVCGRTLSVTIGEAAFGVGR